MRAASLTLSPERAFAALTGFALRPWQRAFLEQLINTAVDAWPTECSVPTGMGKSLIPVMALLAAAYRHDAPRRIVYVVNRRMVVDGVHETAQQVAASLRDPRSCPRDEDRPIIEEIRAALLAHCGLDHPELAAEAAKAPEVLLLRGGMDTALGRIESPVIPTIVVSTLDQAMSRLLFRGYGQRPQSWPIQAGLLAFDTLWIVDEAHISMATVQTLQTVGRTIRRAADHAELGRPFHLLTATATPRRDWSRFVAISDGEHAVYEAQKPTTIDILAETPEKPVEDFTARAIGWVGACLQDRAVKRIGIICNTIALARATFDALRSELEPSTKKTSAFGGAEADSILLIGAIREYERERLLGSPLMASLKTQAPRPDRPVIAVSTQTVETGPDLDFDRLLSQVSPLDALAQRFGRLNRRGTSGSPGGLIYGFPSEDLYGKSPMQAAQALTEVAQHGMLDFSPRSIDDLIEKLRVDSRYEATLSPVKHAEPLLPQHERSLARTWPPSVGDPRVEVFIHGEIAGEVSICWRNRVTEELLGSEDTAQLERIAEWLDLVPIANQETATISLRMVKALLRRSRKNDGSDGADVVTDEDDARDSLRAIRVRAGEVAIVDATGVGPGDILILPTSRSYAWHDEFGMVTVAARGAAPVLDVSGEGEPARSSVAVVPVELVAREDDETMRAWYRRARDAVRLFFEDRGDRAFLACMDEAVTVDIEQHPLDETVALVIARTRRRSVCDDDSSTRREVGLEEHLRDVERCAATLATAVQVAQQQVGALARSGLLHDLGKVHPHFQAVRLGNEGAVPLAKSDKGDVGSRLQYRHEGASVAMLNGSPSLIRHLVGSHHGYGRPGFPKDRVEPRELALTLGDETFVGMSDHRLHEIGAGWSGQFQRLCKTYSPWGLAYLEAILRLADWKASIEERYG